MSESAEIPKKKTRVTSKAKPKVSARAATPGKELEPDQKTTTAISKPQVDQKSSNDQTPLAAKKTVTKTAAKKSVAKPTAKKTTRAKTSEKTGQSQATATAKPSTTKAKQPKAAKRNTVSKPTPSKTSTKAKATASKIAPVQPQIPDAETIDKMVAEAAYYLAEKRNFAVGFEEEDWVTAKLQIMEQWQETNHP